MAGPIDPALRRRLKIDLAMVALALASMGLLFYELFTVLTPHETRLLDLVDIMIVAVFIAEFFWSARRSGDWRRYVRENWYDIPGMIPITSEMAAAVRSFRLLRLLRIIRILRVIRAFARIRRLMRYAGGLGERARLFYIGLVATFVVAVGGILAYDFERGTNAQFRGPWDGIWWALVTTATVGYGDLFPITTGGRIVAAFLMVTGVGIIGTLAGSLGAALLSTPTPSSEPETKDPTPDRRRVLVPSARRAPQTTGDRGAFVARARARKLPGRDAGARADRAIPPGRR